jgi:hypothetical protein
MEFEKRCAPVSVYEAENADYSTSCCIVLRVRQISYMRHSRTISLVTLGDIRQVKVKVKVEAKAEMVRERNLGILDRVGRAP